MNIIKIADLEASIHENLGIELPLEQRLEELIVAWEADSESFEKLDEEIDLENEMFALLEKLEDRNLWREIEKLDRALRSQPNRYDKYSKYISQTLIPLYLADDRENAKVQKDRIENYVKSFFKCPEERCEILFNVLDKLICYDQSSIAVDLCKQTYVDISKYDGFFINPKDEIAEIIVWDVLQDAYVKLKKNIEVDWLSCEKIFKSYGFQYTQEEYNIFEEVMNGRLDIVRMRNIFKNKISFVLFQIKLAFCCQMYDLDGTSFVTSNNFASKVIDFLATIPGRQRCPLHTFFKIKPNALVPYIQKLVDGTWFDATYNQFAFIGALSIFYLGLLKLGIIDLKTIEEMLPSVALLGTEYKKIHSDRPWTFNFSKKLQGQSTLLVQSYQHPSDEGRAPKVST